MIQFLAFGIRVFLPTPLIGLRRMVALMDGFRYTFQMTPHVLPWLMLISQKTLHRPWLTDTRQSCLGIYLGISVTEYEMKIFIFEGVGYLES
jgi:hypothetical protein